MILVVATVVCTVPLWALERALAEELTRRAITAAVVSRVGSTADVTVSAIQHLRIVDTDGPIVAEPDYAARAGRPSRFALFLTGSRRVRVGEATAVVVFTADAVRTRRYLARGEVIQAADLEPMRGDFEGARFLAAPAANQLAGARTVRDLAAGATLTSADVVPERIVTAGATVRGIVRVAGVEIVSRMVALQSGAINDIVPIMPSGTRRTLRGRVVGRGEVEVLDVR